MDHILDNPVYNALISGNKHLAKGTETVKYYPYDVAPFVGMKVGDNDNFQTLFDMVSPGQVFALFVPAAITIPAPWKTLDKMKVLQMVCHRLAEAAPDPAGIIPLNTSHVPDMLSLTKLTNPGPFKINTIVFGNYKGIFEQGRLASMAGHRMHAFDYVEVSAVCTHPDFMGKGYSRRLLLDQIHGLHSIAKTPFLHVKSENTRAIKLYESVGFRTRRSMDIYVISK